jgi:hypothetical protein
MIRRHFLKGTVAAAAIAWLAISHALIFPVGAVSSSSTGATFDFYISPTGSDSNTGTSVSSPWAITSLYLGSSHQSTIAHHRIGLLPGTYTVTGVTVAEYEDNVLTIPYGASGSPTYIGSSDSSGHYSPRTATIDWVDTSGGIGGLDAGLIGPPNASSGTPGYVTIDGLVLDGGNTTGGHIVQVFSTIGQTGGFQNGGATYPVGVIVENCEIRNIIATDGGNNDAGIFVNGTNGGLFTNNYIHDITKPNQADHAHGWEEYGSIGNQVTYNTFARDTASVESKGGSSSTVVAYNYITAGQWGGISGFDGENGSPNTPSGSYSIHNNVLDNNGTGIGINPSGNPNGPSGAPNELMDQTDGTGYALGQGLNYYANTIYDPRSGSIQTAKLNQFSNSFQTNFYNNLIYAPSGHGTGGGATPGMVNLNFYTTLDYNCYSMGTFGMGTGGSTYSTLLAWQTAIGADAHSISTASPGFIGSIVSGNGPTQFQLSNTSPCFGTGQGGVNMGAWDGTVTQIGANWAPATP